MKRFGFARHVELGMVGNMKSLSDLREALGAWWHGIAENAIWKRGRPDIITGGVVWNTLESNTLYRLDIGKTTLDIVGGELRHAILETSRANRISIPFPQTEVHLPLAQ